MSNKSLKPDEQVSAMPAPPLVTNATSAKVLYTALDNSYEHYDGRKSVVFGAVQLVGGVLCIICQGILYTIGLSVANYLSAGIWCGLAVSWGCRMTGKGCRYIMQFASKLGTA